MDLCIKSTKKVDQALKKYSRALQEQHSKDQVIAMCHLGTSQGIQVMRMFSKLPSTLLATGMAAALLGGLTLLNTAQAIELSSDSPSYGDTLVARHNSYGNLVLVNTGLGVSDLEKLQSTVKSNVSEIDSLKKTVSDQARLIEDLKRNSGSSSSSSTSEISSLKRTVEEQDRDIQKLASQVEDLKRSAGSSSSSSSNELSSLKRDVSNQDRTIDQLKRTVEDLSRKVK